MLMTRIGVLVTLAAAVAPRGSVSAQPAGPTLSVADYLDFERVGSPEISPDGKTVLYSRGFVDKVNDTWSGAIWQMNADGTKNRFLSTGGGAVWSPDGTRIAYVAASENPKGAQIFVRYMDAEGATTQITRLTEPPGNLTWSPDGQWISFTSLVAKSSEWAIEMPAPPPNAKWTPAPRVADRLHYRADHQGYTDPGFTHLFVVPADGGSPRQITRGDWSVGAAFDGMIVGGSHSWTPDGQAILFDGFAEPNSTGTSVSRIFTRST